MFDEFSFFVSLEGAGTKLVAPEVFCGETCELFPASEGGTELVEAEEFCGDTCVLLLKLFGVFELVEMSSLYLKRIKKKLKITNPKSRRVSQYPGKQHKVLSDFFLSLF